MGIRLLPAVSAHLSVDPRQRACRAGGASVITPFHGIDPQHYFTQLLTNLPATPIGQLSNWLPDQWRLRNPARSA
jgi:hypothetical protein